MKTCSKCLITYDLSLFVKDKNRKDGLQPQCKNCDKEYRSKHLENLSKNWKSGASHKMAKLTEEQVIEIKKQLASGLLPKQVADKLKLSYYSIKDIHRGKAWKNIKI